MRKSILAAALFASALITMPAIAQAPAAPAGPAVERKVIQQTDGPGGTTAYLVQVTLPVGANEGRHIHSGPLMLRVISGELTLDYEGHPTITYKPGDSFLVDGGKQHEGHNRGTIPCVAVAAFVTPKGAPLTTQVETNGK